MALSGHWISAFLVFCFKCLSRLLFWQNLYRRRWFLLRNYCTNMWIIHPAIFCNGCTYIQYWILMILINKSFYNRISFIFAYQFKEKYKLVRCSCRSIIYFLRTQTILYWLSWKNTTFEKDVRVRFSKFSCKEKFSKIFFFSYSIFVVKKDNMCKEEILFSTLLAFDLYFVTMHKQKQYYLCAEGSLLT